MSKRNELPIAEYPGTPARKSDGSGLIIFVLILLCLLVGGVLISDNIARTREASAQITESNNAYKTAVVTTNATVQMFITSEGTTRLQSFLATIASPQGVVYALGGVVALMFLAVVFLKIVAANNGY